MIDNHVMQIFLAPTPAKAWFLKPAERRWLQKRQDDTHEEAMKRTHGANSSMIDGLINWRLWYLGTSTRHVLECDISQVRTVMGLAVVVYGCAHSSHAVTALFGRFSMMTG